jgi:hypothetical protein
MKRVWLILGLLLFLTACLPEPPGIAIKVTPGKKSAEGAKKEIIKIVNTVNYELIFAPSPEYPKSFRSQEFNGYWSTFGSSNILGATAVVKKEPITEIGINYDKRNNEILVTVGYLNHDKKVDELTSLGKRLSQELLSLLKEHYKEENVVIMREKGAL